mmetsp:Transcript_6021/g.13711  ORF Transcript_6021/g.13711 Transcript_6021/m.13711 type:complete len:206 (+) Transcript_6021:71-688(+)
MALKHLGAFGLRRLGAASGHGPRVVVVTKTCLFSTTPRGIFGSLKDGLYSFLTVKPVVESMLLKVIDDKDICRVAAKATAIGAYSTVGLTLLGTAGVDISPILAGAGVTSLVAGLALKDVAANFFSGVTLLVDRPFSRGSRITVYIGSGAPLEGVIEAIDFRHVHLRTADGAALIIPTAAVVSNPVRVAPDRSSDKQLGASESKQ